MKILLFNNRMMYIRPAFGRFLEAPRIFYFWHSTSLSLIRRFIYILCRTRVDPILSRSTIAHTGRYNGFSYGYLGYIYSHKLGCSFRRQFYSLNYKKPLSSDFSDETCLSKFPEEILDVFKSRLRRKLTGREEASIKNYEVLDILKRVQDLMKNVDPTLHEGRVGTLETNS